MSRERFVIPACRKLTLRNVEDQTPISQELSYV
jgi:hypothetical protein